MHQSIQGNRIKLFFATEAQRLILLFNLQGKELQHRQPAVKSCNPVFSAGENNLCACFEAAYRLLAAGLKLR